MISAPPRLIGGLPVLGTERRVPGPTIPKSVNILAQGWVQWHAKRPARKGTSVVVWTSIVQNNGSISETLSALENCW